MINSVAVLQSSTDVASVAVKIDERRNAAAFLLRVANEIRVEGNFIASFYVNNFKGEPVDLRGWYTRSVWADVRIEQQVILN